MAGNYEKGMYNQLMEVMARLDAVESSLSIEKAEHKDEHPFPLPGIRKPANAAMQ